MPASLNKIPVAALSLGLGGLLPFFASAAMVVSPSLFSNALLPVVSDAANGTLTSDAFSQSSIREWGIRALGTYGALILSFLGGVRWGNLLHDTARVQRWSPLTMSVLPTLIAWPALLLPTTAMLIILICGFLIQYVADVNAVRSAILPAWFGRLRLILTSGAVLSLLVSLIVPGMGSTIVQ